MTWTAEMARPVLGGPTPSTLREQLEAAASKGVASARASLLPPAFPESLAYLWSWWLELHAARPQSQHGLAPITFGELAAWSQLTRTAITSWEVAVLLRMDRTFRTISSAPA